MPETPLELQPVQTRLNELLVRLQAAFLREKTLTADIAHELRTPLSGIRSTLEVALHRDRDDGEYRESMRNCLEICSQTQRIVETLLTLARLEDGRESVDRSCVDVEHVLLDCWQSFVERANDRALVTIWDCRSGVILNTDSAMFRVRAVQSDG